MTEEPRPERLAARSVLLVASVFVGVALWNVAAHRLAVSIVTGLIGAALLLVTVVSKKATRSFYHAWMRLAAVLGYVNSRILLTLVYFMLFTPYSILLRATGRDPLGRRGPTQQSYWIRRSSSRQASEQFERMF